MEGIYDDNGKCVRCGTYHPCNCEIHNTNEEKEAEETASSKEESE